MFIFVGLGYITKDGYFIVTSICKKISWCQLTTEGNSIM